MVKAAARFLLLAALLPAAFNLPAKELSEYKIGEAAEEDISTPVPLVVIDAEATKVLKAREAERIPVHLRFLPNTAVEVQRTFRSNFVATRNNFLDALEKKFGRRKLDAEEITSAGFQDLIIAFQRTNKLFPVNPNLAALWAGGESDAPVESDFATRLDAVMQRPVRGTNQMPADLKIGGSVRLVPVANSNEIITAQFAGEYGTNIPKTNLISFQRSKTDLQSSFPDSDRAAGRYMASLVRPNCFVEEELTRQLRAKRVEQVWAADHYAAGQLLVKRGQTIDEKIKLALEQLKEKSAIGQLQQQKTAIGEMEQNLHAVQSKAEEEKIAAGQLQERLQRIQWQAARDKTRNQWLAAGSVALGLIVIFGIWKMARRKTPMSLLPAASSANSWQQRALVAEQRAEKAHAVVRSGFLGHLAQLISTRLISQRAELIEAQMKAAVELSELVQRLEKVHAPLQERVLAYERRISELEIQLALKAEENRELIRAKIEATRKQLAMERGKTSWN